VFDNNNTWSKLLDYFNEGQSYYVSTGSLFGFSFQGGRSFEGYRLLYSSEIKTFNEIYNTILKPRGITTKGQLQGKIDDQKQVLENVQTDIKNLSGDEYKKDTISRITQEQQALKEQGVATESSPEVRAKEFAEPIVEKDGYIYYYGSEYQDITLYQEKQARADVEKELEKYAISDRDYKSLSEKEKDKRSKQISKAVRKSRKKIDFSKLPAQDFVPEQEFVSDDIKELLKEIEEIQNTLAENDEILDSDEKNELYLEIKEVEESIEMLKEE
jgi:hypothetical protein